MTTLADIGGSSGSLSLRRPRSISCRESTSLRHCTRSFMTFSRADGFRCAGPYSTPSSGESSLLCRVCWRGRVVALRSRLEAAASRSGQSDLFTNSNWGRAKSPDLFDEAVRLRAAVDDSGGKNSQDSTSTSSSALVVDSLNSCRVAATFLPIPGATECC